MLQGLTKDQSQLSSDMVHEVWAGNSAACCTLCTLNSCQGRTGTMLTVGGMALSFTHVLESSNRGGFLALVNVYVSADADAGADDTDADD